MSDKPTELPEWGSNGGTVLVDPGGTKKGTGWAFKERVGAQHLNWILEKVYRWLEWLDNGLLTRSSLTDNSPVMATTDRDGRIRSYLGPEGYTMGPAIQEQYRPSPIDNSTNLTTGASSDVSPAMGLTSLLNANTSIRIHAGSSGGGPNTSDPRMELKVLNAAVAERVLVMSEYGPATPYLNQPISDLNNVAAVMEWRAFLDSVAMSGWAVLSGLHDFNSAAGNLAMIGTGNKCAAFLLEPSTGANFRCIAINGTAKTDVDSGVTAAANTLYTFRVELHGLNTPVGVDAGGSVARYFIDGVEVAEITTANVPSGSVPVGVCHLVDAITLGPTADKSMFVATTKLAWNAVLDPDVPA